MTKALAKVDTTRLAKKGDFKSELAKYAKEDSAREPAGVGGNFVSIRGKSFTFKGDGLGEPLKAVIVNYAYENAFYDTDYDEDNPSPPACFAVGMVEERMAPHETSPKPQAESCKECPHNQFGSAEKGHGKACKNNRRLLLLSTDVKKFDEKHVASAELAMMRLPPTSAKFFRGYVKKMTEGLQLPLWAVVTSLSFDEDAAHPIVMPQFDAELTKNKAVIDALKKKRGTTEEQLLQPYDVSSYGQASKPQQRGKAAARPAPAKGGGKGKGKQDAPFKGSSPRRAKF